MEDILRHFGNQGKADHQSTVDLLQNTTTSLNNGPQYRTRAADINYNDLKKLFMEKDSTKKG